MIPEGWKLVPIEPTDAMFEAASREETTSDKWTAMLNVAPEALEFIPVKRPANWQPKAGNTIGTLRRIE